MNPKQRENLPWREIGGRCVVINPQRGEVHELDEVGSFLWREADGASGVDAIGTKVAVEFDVDAA